ncbi:MAG TPA: ferritin-like domain-containing protein, partial [Allosphingosinicella sp.]|nr:ferritin-like domain-containing protein [Allosphingosinicella sp.]
VLNLEYLQAQFYSFAVFGEGLDAALLTGSGTQGAAVGGRRVAFADPVIAQQAREIAREQRDQVEYLRELLASYVAAQPQIDISGGAAGAFTAMARGAGLVGANQAFNPYASDDNFLLAAFFLQDLAVTAYQGAHALLNSTQLRDVFAGLLAAEAFHASAVRTTLFLRGMARPELQDATVAISDYRDSLDGPEDKDQGVVRGNNRLANIVPANGNGLGFGRRPGEVLNILYLRRPDVDEGGFFPQGVNGVVTTSDDNAG